ncbi:MAG: hypothetical protein Q7O66_17420 [Dehalococcoidia bacterium]|nr:hypothetical protein [Dehalococcoidia bacterium]
MVTRLYSPEMSIDEKDVWKCQAFAAMPPSFLQGVDSTSLELLGEKVHEAKKAGLPVGANVMLGAEAKPWVEAAKVAEKAGADFLELNLSCPRWPLGLHFCRDESITQDIVASVRRTTRLPIVAKLHAWLLPNELRSLAMRVVNAGADAISTTNIFYGVVGVDVNTGLPWAHDVDDQGTVRGTATAFSGPVTLPVWTASRG